MGSTVNLEDGTSNGNNRQEKNGSRAQLNNAQKGNSSYNQK